MDERWKKRRYLFVESDCSVGMIGDTPKALAQQKKMYPETRVLKTITARCACEAGQQYKQHFWGENYDMYFCREDEANGDEVCPHYAEMLEMTGAKTDAE